MADYIIVGAGAAGLFTAWRLLKSNRLGPDDSIKLYEWSPTYVGGRIRTHTFEGPGTSKQYCELGGMRFATDAAFPRSIHGGHVLVQHLIRELGLASDVERFVESPSRLYFLRGRACSEGEITSGAAQLPYNFESNRCRAKTADQLLADIAATFAGKGSTKWTRQQWCEFLTHGAVPGSAGMRAIPGGTPIRDVGYGDLLMALLGEEGLDYVADANGYSSHVMDWNSGDAIRAHKDFGAGVEYSQLRGGYGKLFTALRREIESLSLRHRDSGIAMGHRLLRYDYDTDEQKFLCTFEVDGREAASRRLSVMGDYLFLAMPRRALEMVAENCTPEHLLRQKEVKYYLESALEQPSLRIAMVFDTPWWSDPSICRHMPRLTRGAGGPTLTDLPLRQLYYFGDNGESGGTGAGPHVLLASHEGLRSSAFWREMERQQDGRKCPRSMDYQPLHGPTEVSPDSPMVHLLIHQLAAVHGADPLNIPMPRQTLYQDWSLNPFGAGHHAWAAHYDVCEAMRQLRAPAQIVLEQQKLFIVGSCYSFDQAWVEGALCVAESVLRDFLGLPGFCALPEGYVLIAPEPRKQVTPEAVTGVV